MRRALHLPTGTQYLAESVPPDLSDAPKGDWRCPNPACGEPCSHVEATDRHRAFFKHVVGVADMETCYYFAEETPTQRYHDCVDLLEEDLTRRFDQQSIVPEAWVDEVSYPLDLMVQRPDGQQWGFWYVSPRRASMTLNLVKQATAAGIQVTIFTHIHARKPAELFEAKGQQSFFLEPEMGSLSQIIDHKEVAGPIERWEYDDAGRLVPPPVQAPPPPPTFAPRPAAPGAPAQMAFFTDPVPEAPPAPSIQPVHPVSPREIPAGARSRSVWRAVDKGSLPADLSWIIQAPADEWAPELLDWFLSRRMPFRISQACQFCAQRWRLDPTVKGPHDLVFLRAMHEFWGQIAEQGHVRLVEFPHPMHVVPVRRSEVTS